MPTEATSAPHTMRCLEVWGGNQAVDNGVVMAGLDAWLYARPCHDHAAGGDIHYVSSCAAGMLTRVLVADISGHGPGVADAAVKLRSLMRRYVNFIDQSRFVQGLNVEFGSVSDAGGFATAVVATYVSATDELTLCNAGHPRPLWYRSRTRSWSFMANPEARAPRDGLSNVPLGIAEPTCYDQTVIKLATGDLVVLYSDSLIEARSPEGKLLGQEGLLELVRGLDPSDPGEFMHSLLESVARHGALEDDDVTVLLLRPNGLKKRESAAVMLKAMKALATAAVASLRPGGPEFPWMESGPVHALGRLANRINPRWGVPPLPAQAKPHPK